MAKATLLQPGQAPTFRSGCRGDDELWSRSSCIWVGVNWKCHLLQPRAELNSFSDRNSGSGDTGGVLCGWHHPVWCQQKRVLSPESIVLPPIKFRRMLRDWDLARRRSSTLSPLTPSLCPTPVSTSTRSQVTITPPPITPSPPTRRMTRAQASITTRSHVTITPPPLTPSPPRRITRAKAKQKAKIKNLID